MRELVVIEQRALGVGHDELVGLLAIAHRKRVVLIVFDEADDFELELRAFVGLDVKQIAQFEGAVFV